MGTLNLKSTFTEIRDSRNVLKALVIKNLIGKYRNSALGFGWHFIMPIILLCTYYTVFTQIRSIPIPDFWIYLASGLFPFNFMINNLSNGSSCIVGNAGMIKKMYFPREIIVLSQVISTFIIMLIGYTIILIATIISGHGLGLSIIALPIMFILTFIFTLGYVFLFSAITVYFRDFQHFITSTSMIFFFMTPMYFLFDSITGIFRLVVSLNPLTYFIESFHEIMYYHTFPSLLNISLSIVISTLSLSIGLLVFHTLKTGFVERL